MQPAFFRRAKNEKKPAIRLVFLVVCYILPTGFGVIRGRGNPRVATPTRSGRLASPRQGEPTRALLWLFEANGFEMRDSMRRLVGVWGCWAILTVSACGSAHWRSGRYDNGQVHYEIGEPGAGWERLKLADANAAWRNSAHRASLLVNSHCVGVEDASLRVLSRHLWMGMEEAEVLAEREQTIAGRAALETSVRGTLDGVPRQLQLLVLKKDGCVYDLVLEGHPDAFARSLPDFERLRDSWRIFRRKDWK